MTKIIIIGSKGFIGSHLTNWLSRQADNEVWGCDVLNDYAASRYFVIDASNSDFEELFSEHPFDICINCSGSASVPDSMIHPARDFYLNTVNVFRLLEAIRKHAPTCKFLTISSAAVYGNPSALPIKETAALQPLSPYGYHKLQTEIICEEYNRFYKLATCYVRIFSAYGNGLKKQLFWDIAQKANLQTEVHLFGTGNESRDFIHVLDICRAIELVMTKGDFDNSCYNIGNGIEIKIRDAAEKITALSGNKSTLHFDGTVRPGDPLNWRADISKLSDLGYRQQITIEQGLTDYITWLREEKLG